MSLDGNDNNCIKKASQANEESKHNQRIERRKPTLSKNLKKKKPTGAGLQTFASITL